MSNDLQNYSIEEAADILRCFPRFLEDNLKRFPHQKLGAAVAFDSSDLVVIKDMCRVRPTVAAEHVLATPPQTLASIQPSRRKRIGA
jgi:hypothetical protein